MLQNTISQREVVLMSTTAKVFIVIGVVAGALCVSFLIGAHEIEALIYDELDSFM